MRWPCARATHVLGQEHQGALQRLLRRRRVVAGALVAVEAVVRRVHQHLHLRVRGLQRLHAVHRHGRVVVGQVRHHRHAGLAGDFGRLRHAAAVVRHRRRQAMGLRSGPPGPQTAPAVADDADFSAAAFSRRVVDGGLDVGQHARRGQRLGLGFQRNAGLNVGVGVRQIHARLHALERGRRHRQVAGLGIAVGHAADVRIDAKDFLQHHDGAAHRAVWLRHVGRHLLAIGRGEVDPLSHAHLLLIQ